MSREKWYQNEINKMISVVAGLENTQQVEEIFDQIITPREINDMARRLAAVEMLNEGISYSEIREKLNLSPIIISRLANKIGYGFRRSSTVIKSDSPKAKRAKKPIRKYKGATPIHRMFD